MRQITASAALLVVLALWLAAPPAQAGHQTAQKLRHCPRVNVDTTSGTWRANHVRAKGTNCRTARKVIRRFLGHTPPQAGPIGGGWNCNGGSSGDIFCVDGNKTVLFRFYFDVAGERLRASSSTTEPAPKAGVHKCEGRVYQPFAGWTNIRAVGLNCKKAQRHLERFLDTGNLDGWVQSFNGAREVFTKGDKRISGIPLGD